MRQGSARVPFTERGGHLRGVIDLATGVYPAFLFGGAVGRQLPVFHIHEVTPASLEPHLRHIAENGYRTLVADEIADFIRTGHLPAERCVALTFDDAWASLWTVAAPLLRRYGLRAITFAVPGRMTDAIRVRPTLDDGIAGAGSEDASETPFVTWVELKVLQASGTIDVQAHSLTHIAQFCSSEPVGFVTPAYASEPMLNRPIVSIEGAPRFLQPSAAGRPALRPPLAPVGRHQVPGRPDRRRAHDRLRGGERRRGVLRRAGVGAATALAAAGLPWRVRVGGGPDARHRARTGRRTRPAGGPPRKAGPSPRTPVGGVRSNHARPPRAHGVRHGVRGPPVSPTSHPGQRRPVLADAPQREVHPVPARTRAADFFFDVGRNGSPRYRQAGSLSYWNAECPTFPPTWPWPSSRTTT